MTHVLRAVKEPDTVKDVVSIDLKIASDFLRDGEIDKARKIATRVLNDDPNNAAALFIIAWVFIKLEEYGLAYSMLKRSLEFKQRAEAYNNLGMALIGMGKHAEAQDALKKAIKKRPGHMQALNNLALIEVYNSNPEKAIQYAMESLEQNPNQWEVRETLGYAKLLSGDLAGGWEGYEAMVGHTKWRTVNPPHPECPYWMGEEELDVYVHGEQGIGDEISFSSILPEFAAKQHSVVYDCHEKLEGLFRRTFPNIEIHGKRWSKDKDFIEGRQFDAHCLIGSLASHYRKSTTEFSGEAFLVSDPERRTQWRALLDTLPGKKVGIAWKGGSAHTFRNRRSLDLEALLPILKIPGITWVSLDYSDPTAELEQLEETHGIKIHHWKRAAESNDYDDQAALVAELDFVVSVCTAIVHLSGGLGKKCFVLVPNKPRWFYGMKGEQLPWYKSVKMFRQTTHWPIDAVRQEIERNL